MEAMNYRWFKIGKTTLLCLLIGISFVINFIANNSASIAIGAHRRRMQPAFSSSIFQTKPSNTTKGPPCYRQVQVWLGGTSPQRPKLFDCPGQECGIKFVEDVSYETMNDSEALILFHRTSWNWAEMQRRRPSNQKWVFYSLESPVHTNPNAIPPVGLESIYDYTISYRPSSTIHGPYGYYDGSVPQVSLDDKRNWAEGRTGLIAWAASNCNLGTWPRLAFVTALSEHIKVDTYGKCGSKKDCPRTDDCWNRLARYKFYLALENSECRDYITEKFWWNSLSHDMVPIVYGPPREDYERVAPPNSFIHLQDFNNFEEFTTYINRIDSNDTLYNSFFEWKRHGSVINMQGEDYHEILSAPFSCKVVSKLSDDERDMSNGHNIEERPNPNMNDYWTSTCFKATGFPHDF